ncbi:MAG: peptidylprolyl isomerase, partial [Phycisphaerae bacterium]
MIRLHLTLAVLAGASVILAEQARGQDNAASTNPRVKMSTTLGDIVLELDARLAPVTVYNFLRYADEKFYDGTIFHRVMPNFMIQGGGMTPDLEKKTTGLHPAIRNEWQNGLKNLIGTISMARLGRQPDSATNQFFINVKDNTALDQPRDGAGYCVFGKVVEDTAPLVFVLFFTLVGVSLDLDVLAKTWTVALGLLLVRRRLFKLKDFTTENGRDVLVLVKPRSGDVYRVEAPLLNPRR